MDAGVFFKYKSNIMKQGQSGIPSYNLYGEIGDLPDVAHCEAISTRSALHNWRIKPHRHARLHQFFYVSAGGGQYFVDGQKYDLAPPQILNIPPRTVHGFEYEAGTSGWVVTVPVEVLNQHIANDLAPLLNSVCQIAPDDDLPGLFDVLAREHSERRFARAHILQSLTMLIVGHIVRALSETEEDSQTRAGSPLFFAFETLLEQHLFDHWTLGQYAQKLGATPTHLSRLARQYAGISASKVIEGRLMQEARRDLAYTSLTISEIAYRIGFGDPAYFARVFARATGVTPSAFRSRLEQGK